MNPQLFGPLMDGCYAAGALDVFYTPVQMKKNRPGTLVTVIAPPERRAGARPTSCSASRRRSACATRRCCASASTARCGRSTRPAGRCASRWRGATAQMLNAAPEFEDCARVAGERGHADQGRSRRVAIKARLGPRCDQSRIGMSRFYLTTAIDYVNSRPHLGHRLREDHRRRHRPLQAAARASRRGS